MADVHDTLSRSEIESRLRELELKTDVRFERIVGEMRTGFAELRSEICATKADILKWLFGAIGFQTLVVVGAIFGALALYR